MRKALYNLLSWYLPLASPVLAPHLPMLTLLASSALSHIFAEIRLDAAKVVSLMLELDLLERSDSNGILQGLCLAMGSNPPAKHKLVYLSAIEQYVRKEAKVEASANTGGAEYGYLVPIPKGGDVGWQLGEQAQQASIDNNTVCPYTHECAEGKDIRAAVSYATRYIPRIRPGATSTARDEPLRRGRQYCRVACRSPDRAVEAHGCILSIQHTARHAERCRCGYTVELGV